MGTENLPHFPIIEPEFPDLPKSPAVEMSVRMCLAGKIASGPDLRDWPDATEYSHRIMEYADALIAENAKGMNHA